MTTRVSHLRLKRHWRPLSLLLQPTSEVLRKLKLIFILNVNHIKLLSVKLKDGLTASLSMSWLRPFGEALQSSAAQPLFVSHSAPHLFCTCRARQGFFSSPSRVSPHDSISRASNILTRWSDATAAVSPRLMLLFECHGNQNGTCRHSRGPVHHVPATTRSRRFVMACRHPWRTTGPSVCFNKAPDACLFAYSHGGKWNVNAQLSLAEKAERKTITERRASVLKMQSRWTGAGL